MEHRANVTGEIERKFEVAAAGEVASLDPGTVMGGVVAADPHERLLEAVYYDTPDLRLLFEGVTLRRRTGGEDAEWHLKTTIGRTRFRSSRGR
jgi:inorganic triphosphatase YgiF